jgi:DNA-binding response OmpR family regulator
MTRVLVLDEHYASALVLRLALEERGLVCRIATGADEALGQIVVFRPELVLYEWKLKDNAGIGLAARLRAVADKGCIPRIVALSTQTEPDGFRVREQVDAYFVKPFGSADLDVLLAARR